MTDLPDTRGRSAVALPMGDWGEKRVWKCEPDSGVGRSALDEMLLLESALTTPAPGGDMRSMFWKAPL